MIRSGECRETGDRSLGKFACRFFIVIMMYIYTHTIYRHTYIHSGLYFSFFTYDISFLVSAWSEHYYFNGCTPVDL